MRLVIVLTAVCVISGLFLGLTYTITKNKIEYQKEQEEKAAVLYVLPQAEKVSSKINAKEIDYYEGYDSSGKVIGYAFAGSGKGYSSTINIMIGVSPEMDIQRIKILSQQETPGLGDKVGEVKSTATLWDLLRGKKLQKPGQPWFQAQFNDKSLDTLSEIKFITGATITGKAVLDIVKKSIEEFENELQGTKSL